MVFRKKRKDPFKEIQSCLQKRDYKGALDWFHTLLQKDPKNTQIRLRFADTLVLAGNKREAVKQLREVADGFAEKGFMVRAIAINKKIVQIDPSQTDVLEKLAEMRDERQDAPKRRQRLSDALRRPGEPIRREEAEDDEPSAAEEEPEVAAPPPPAAPVETPAPAPAPEPEVVPAMSLEESMAMEFGETSASSSVDEAPSAPPVEDAPVVVPEPEPEAPVLGDAPDFSEEPFEIGTADEEVEIVALDGVEDGGSTDLSMALGDTEEPVSASPEIVLEMDAAEPPSPDLMSEPEIVTAEEPLLVEADDAPMIIESSDDFVVSDELSVDIPAADDDVVILDESAVAAVAADDAGLVIEDEPIVMGDDAAIIMPADDGVLVASSADEVFGIAPGEELEVVEFDMAGEPEISADESEALLGALGEDIDSLIDSIIDDVGNSSMVTAPEAEEESPTHIPLFSDLTTPEFIDVALLLVRRVFKPEETAVGEGDPGDSMFIISTGEVRATVDRGGQQLPVATLKDGDFFGEMSVLTGEPRTATVTAVKTTEVLELSRDNFLEICRRHPHVEAKVRLAYDERVSGQI